MTRNSRIPGIPVDDLAKKIADCKHVHEQVLHLSWESYVYILRSKAGCGIV